jgi:hypothetical protein
LDGLPSRDGPGLLLQLAEGLVAALIELRDGEAAGISRVTVTEPRDDRLIPIKENSMSVKTVWERAKVEGKDVLEYVKKAVAEGNARRIVIKQKGNKLVEFPLTIGVVGAVFAPMLAAVGAIAALVSECSVEIEKVVPDSKPAKSTSTKKTRKSTGRRS